MRRHKQDPRAPWGGRRTESRLLLGYELLAAQGFSWGDIVRIQHGADLSQSVYTQLVGNASNGFHLSAIIFAIFGSFSFSLFDVAEDSDDANESVVAEFIDLADLDVSSEHSSPKGEQAKIGKTDLVGSSSSSSDSASSSDSD